MEVIGDALGAAAPVWEQAVRQASWYHGIFVAAYLGAAWLCFLNGYMAKGTSESTLIWYLAAAALCALGANTILHADLFVTCALRTLAKLEGWYEGRRVVQSLAIFALASLALMAAFRLRAEFATCDAPSETVAWGLTAILVILSVRTVSAHWTDAIIDHRVLGLSLGRLFELAGIGLVLRGAWRCLRLR